MCAGFVLDVMPSLLCFDIPDLAESCPHVPPASHSFLSQVLRVEASWENLLTTLSSFLLAFALLYFLLLHLSEPFSTLPSSNYLLLISLVFIVVSCPCFCAFFSESFSALSPLLACLLHTPSTVSRKTHVLCHASAWRVGILRGGNGGELLASESFFSKAMMSSLNAAEKLPDLKHSPVVHSTVKTQSGIRTVFKIAKPYSPPLFSLLH